MSRNVYRMYQAISPKCADIRMNETESIHIRHQSEQDREEKRYRAHCQLRNTVKHTHTVKSSRTLNGSSLSAGISLKIHIFLHSYVIRVRFFDSLLPLLLFFV